MLPAAAASDEQGDVDDRTSLKARLEEVKESIDKLMGHKLRTWYFGKYKTEILKIVQKDPTLAYDLSDYWGKLLPKKSGETVGEGMQSGISVHGSWFEYGKLTVRELKAALEVHGAPLLGLKTDLLARLRETDAAVAAIDAARALS